MYILIDNSPEDQIVFYYTEKRRWKKKIFTRLSWKGDGLLFFFDKLLIEADKKLSDIKGLVVVLGKGKFIATRIATTDANALAYILKVPIIGTNKINCPLLLKKIKAAKSGVYISAKYSAEANIGKNKKK